MPKAKKEEKEAVGEVKVVVRADDGGNEVKRVPVFEGDDPEAILAAEQEESGRNVEKPRRRIVRTDGAERTVTYE